MSNNYIIAIGGTGARVAESFVYYCATGAYKHSGKIIIYVLDHDSTNGNISRLMNTVDSYMAMKTVSNFGNFREGTVTEVSCMLPDFEVQYINLTPYFQALVAASGALNNSISVDKYSNLANSQVDKILLDMFHSEGEQSTPLSEGFWGHPNLGAPIAEQLFNIPQFNSNPMFSEFNRVFNAAESHINIVLTGSIFGGTGATFFPNLANKIRSAIKPTPPHTMEINGVLNLPYYNFADPVNVIPGQEGIVWKSFRKKAAVALESYSKRGEHFVKIDNKCSNSAYTYDFDTLQLVGSSYLDESSKTFVSGGADQVNAFRIPELYSAVAISNAFQGNLTVTNPAMPNIFLATHGHQQVADLPIDVALLNELDPVTRPGELIVKYTCFAYAVHSYLKPQMSKANIIKDNLLTTIFGHSRFLGLGGPADVDLDVMRPEIDVVDEFCSRFLTYVTDLFGVDSGQNDVRFLDYDGLTALIGYTEEYYNGGGGATMSADELLDKIQSPLTSKCIKLGVPFAPVEYRNAMMGVNARSNTNKPHALKMILKAIYDCNA